MKLLKLIVALALVVALPAIAVPSSITGLKAARLLDGRGGIVAPGMVLLDGDRITAVGTALEIPPDAQLIDLGDATLLPGLIDLHTHLCGKYGVHWKDDRIGAIEPGKLADIIAVAGNPLDDIKRLTSVGFVMKSGVVYKDEIRAR